MRASEKTLELNFCAQFSELVRPKRTLWYGPTQLEEARWGFDTRSRLGSLCLLLQFKVLKLHNEGIWRRRVSRRQLCTLQQFSQRHASEIAGTFYAFPLISGHEELEQQPEVLPKTWLLDVDQLPLLPCPSGKDQTDHLEVCLEANMCAKVYIAAARRDFPLLCAQDLVRDLRGGRLIRCSDAMRTEAPLPQPKNTGDQLALPQLLGVVLW
jgi:hypothetical protein